MAIFNTVGSALQSGASKAGINLKSIASGFGLINNKQDASNYDEPLRNSTNIQENIQDLMNVRKSVLVGPEEIRYPPDIDTRYMSFTFYEYKRPNPLKQPERKMRNIITLPLPAHQLAENHDPIIEGRNLGAFGAYMNALESGEGFGSALGMTALNSLNAMQPSLRGTDSNITGMAMQATGFNGPNASGYAQQFFGAAPNPHPNYFFTGVTPRFHTFTWALAPRNAEESGLIRKLVKTFRDNMLPAPLYSGNFLAYPFICDISIIPDDYYYKFKTCFIDFFRASYAPQVFAKTKAPIGVNITITFQEIEIMLSEREVSDSERRIEQLGDKISNAVSLNEAVTGAVEPTLFDIRGQPESGPRR